MYNVVVLCCCYFFIFFYTSSRHLLTDNRTEVGWFDITMLHFVLRLLLHFLGTLQLIVRELIRDLKNDTQIFNRPMQTIKL